MFENIELVCPWCGDKMIMIKTRTWPVCVFCGASCQPPSAFVLLKMLRYVAKNMETERDIDKWLDCD